MRGKAEIGGFKTVWEVMMMKIERITKFNLFRGRFSTLRFAKFDYACSCDF